MVTHCNCEPCVRLCICGVRDRCLFVTLWLKVSWIFFLGLYHKIQFDAKSQQSKIKKSRKVFLHDHYKCIPDTEITHTQKPKNVVGSATMMVWCRGWFFAQQPTNRYVPMSASYPKMHVRVLINKFLLKSILREIVWYHFVPKSEISQM